MGPPRRVLGRLAAASWGHGYATEAALAARDDAFTRLGLDGLFSIIHPDNGRSRLWYLTVA